jgi:acyl carrier protein
VVPVSADVLEQIFRLTLEVGDSDPDTVVRGQYATWDSLAHASLVFTVEQELELEFTPEEIERIDSLGSLREAVSEARGRSSVSDTS